MGQREGCCSGLHLLLPPLSCSYFCCHPPEATDRTGIEVKAWQVARGMMSHQGMAGGKGHDESSGHGM